MQNKKIIELHFKSIYIIGNSKPNRQTHHKVKAAIFKKGVGKGFCMLHRDNNKYLHKSYFFSVSHQ